MGASNSMIGDLFNAVIYTIESKKGKYSLETYLKIIGEYTDRVIIEQKKKGMRFRGGTCTVSKSKSDLSELMFTVRMYFVDQVGQEILQEAKRNIPAKKFTRETLSRLSDEETIFRIDEPK